MMKVKGFRRMAGESGNRLYGKTQSVSGGLYRRYNQCSGDASRHPNGPAAVARVQDAKRVPN